MRQTIVAGNWKMHGSTNLVETFVEDLRQQTLPAGVTTVWLPPVAYLEHCARRLQGAQLEEAVQLGAQDLHAEPAGAYTGETAGSMIADLGGSWVLVGHSERRQYGGETDAQVASKFAAALRDGLVPVLCVGETEAERDAGAAETVVLRQVAAVADLVGATGLERGVIAYEPVWAIGTGRTATVELADSMHRLIRSGLAGIAQNLAERVSILYGGSVKSSNAAELFAAPDIDGGLVGGASQDASEFAAIVAAAAEK